MDRAEPQVLRYMATKGKDEVVERVAEGESNTDRRRLTVTQEAFSSFPNRPNFALGTTQSESIRDHPRLALPPHVVLIGDLFSSYPGGYTATVSSPTLDIHGVRDIR